MTTIWWKPFSLGSGSGFGKSSDPVWLWTTSSKIGYFLLLFIDRSTKSNNNILLKPLLTKGCGSGFLQKLGSGLPLKNQIQNSFEINVFLFIDQNTWKLMISQIFENIFWTIMIQFFLRAWSGSGYYDGLDPDPDDLDPDPDDLNPDPDDPNPDPQPFVQRSQENWWGLN